jgi:hypothetical protein
MKRKLNLRVEQDKFYGRLFVLVVLIFILSIQIISIL